MSKLKSPCPLVCTIGRNKSVESHFSDGRISNCGRTCSRGMGNGMSIAYDCSKLLSSPSASSFFVDDFCSFPFHLFSVGRSNSLPRRRESKRSCWWNQRWYRLFYGAHIRSPRGGITYIYPGPPRESRRGIVDWGLMPALSPFGVLLLSRTFHSGDGRR